MKRLGFYLFFVFIAGSSFAKHPVTIHFPEAPPMTGPLVAPSSHITLPGHVNFEPYIYIFKDSASYDSHWKPVSHAPIWPNTLQGYLTVGLTNWMDFGMLPIVFFNESQGARSVRFGDFTAGFDFQILIDKLDNNLPALKLTLKEIFPSGSYDHLNPDKHLTDISGTGSYISGLILATSRLFFLRGDHWLNVRLSMEYDIPSRVSVRGYNLYGGAEGTKGFVYPPEYYIFDFAFELTLTRRWVLACDTVASFAKQRKFKGNPGQLLPGIPADLTKGSVAQYSLAPALEYNWNSSYGIISGAWFTIAGRNSEKFASWVTAFNYYY